MLSRVHEFRVLKVFMYEVLQDTLDDKLQFPVSSSLTSAAKLKVCFASAWSGGDHANDYVQLSGTLGLTKFNFTLAN